MYLGFFAWYRGLAIGPMARVSQVQLVQPVLTIGWAGLLLGEQLGWATLVGAVVVVLLAGTAVRIRSVPGRAVAQPVPAPEFVAAAR
jgi:drug/metabolite transporter (DMT)-like permease